ncbi:PucR family transcriptional regulator [Modestobacter roseus]|uniref:PucR-like helix-turn-helix protein n=1 Tax=Modestobacter roseus TaxID=1181884 RepID=A0A562IX68_9ACTN|nr:helix-turn-helix domain-containing protein [Modestobacter roseus]MQA34060.1 PucR family transcriptional regulator [Modestobacter roseus]TWH75423.1 PucR-like helix-turn-helix protein [Modestobacter roseus]
MQPFRPQVAARLAELAPPLLDRLDAMADRMAGILTRTESTYAAQSPAVLAELHASIRENLERGVRTLVAGGDDGGEAALDAAREVGRRRAVQGMPLETVLRAYRLGGQVTWEELRRAAQEADAPGDSELLLEVAGSVWHVNDRQCAALAEAYRCEERRLAGIDDQARQQVLDGLLSGRGDDPVFVRAAAELLALPLDGRLVCVVAPPDGAGAPMLSAPGARLLKRGVRSVWGWRFGAQVGVVALGNRGAGELADWLAELAEGPVGLSAVVEGAAAIAAAWRLADTAARTLPPGSRAVAPIDERLPEALLISAPEIADRLVEQTLGRVLALPGDECELLLGTLAAVLAADGSPTRAADALYCHRNTVMHRLRRIEQLTGRSATDPRARLLWQLALLGTGHRRPAERHCR